MAHSFATQQPSETAYLRRMRFAVEVLDAVTLARISNGLKVTVTGMGGKPIMNWGGLYVWLEEGDHQPEQVIVEPGALPYQGVSVPAAPDSLMRIELAPSRDYPFSTGITGLRTTLLETSGSPHTPAVGAEIWLQWIDDTSAGTTWVDAPTHSRTDNCGDFVAVLRLTPTQAPRLDQATGDIRVRLHAKHASTELNSTEFLLPQGRVTDHKPFAWDEFLP